LCGEYPDIIETMHTYFKLNNFYVSSYVIVRFGVTTAVAFKNADFWDVALCGFSKSRRFGGTYRFRHQGEENRQARNNFSRN
jgi:hypothetical protein